MTWYKRHSTHYFWMAFSYVFLAIIVLFIFAPLLIILSSSFKNEVEIFDFPVRLFPERPTLENYKELQDFSIYVWNSFKVTFIIVVLQFFTSAAGAYAFSKLHWKGKNTLFIIYIATMMLPIQSYIIPQFLIVQRFGLYNTHAGLIIISAFTAFGTFLLKQFFETIPNALLESARIEGAGEWKIFYKIVLPLSKPAIATMIIFSFRFFWNNFYFPLIYLDSPEKRTIPLALTTFISQYDVRYGPQMAAAIISMIPVLLLFFFAQRYFISNSAVSGLKG